MLFVDFRNAYEILARELFAAALPAIDFDGPHCRKTVFVLTQPNLLLVGKNILLCGRRDLLDHLLHQMVHVYNIAECGVTEWSSEEYHERFFAPTAIKVGLNLIRHQTRGWAISTSQKVRPCLTPGECEFHDCAHCNTRTASPQARHQRQQAYSKVTIDPRRLAALQEALRDALPADCPGVESPSCKAC